MPTENLLQTVQQQRAAFALAKVQAILLEMEQRNDLKAAKELRSYAAGFPAMIQINGLGQAAAFYRSQGNTYQLLYDLLSEWLTRQRQIFGSSTDLLDGICCSDMHSYRFAQVEALLLLDWVKKFAKAYVQED